MPRRSTWTAALAFAGAVVVFAFAGFVIAQTISHGEAETIARNMWKAGDGKRAEKKWDDAVKAYEKSLEVLARSKSGGVTGDKTTLGMAAMQMIELCKAMPIDLKTLKDGTYEGQAWGYMAQMTIEVTLKGGKMTQFKLKDQKETHKQALDPVPRMIMARHSPSVDAVTNATVTSYGLMTATKRALDKARAADK